MSKLKLNHIQGEIDRKVKDLIDISDISQFSGEQQEQMLLSRSFALYSLKHVSNTIHYSDLKDSITDGFGDNGVDSIYFDKKHNRFYLLQSKWIKSGNGAPDKGEILKFVKGIKDIINMNFSDFNEKVKSKKDDIRDALSNRDIKIKIILAYTGSNASEEALKTITDFIFEEDGGDGIIEFEEFNLNQAHRCLTLGIEGEPINVELDLTNWGKIDEPLKSYFGILNCAQIAQVFSNNKKRLFAQNIRGFMGDGDINNNITKSLISNPENFFYLNNGITILAKKITRAALGGANRSNGKFYCDDITIVNGAQTVGSIYQSFLKNPEKTVEGNVFVRIISLENCPPNFDKKVTIATNTQNKIEKKDFVSLDENQHKLKSELALENINYVYKRDDSIIKSDNNNFHLEEATVALACRNSSVDFSSLAKREIGKLWEDTNNPPYTILFNSDLSGIELVRISKVYRIINNHVKDNIWGETETNALILTHGLYFIIHIVFQSIPVKQLKIKNYEIDENFENEIKSLYSKYYELTLQSYSRLFGQKFPLIVFKNFNSIRKLKDEIYKKEGKLQPGETYSLFD